VSGAREQVSRGEAGDAAADDGRAGRGCADHVRQGPWCGGWAQDKTPVAHRTPGIDIHCGLTAC